VRTALAAVLAFGAGVAGTLLFLRGDGPAPAAERKADARDALPAEVRGIDGTLAERRAENEELKRTVVELERRLRVFEAEGRAGAPEERPAKRDERVGPRFVYPRSERVIRSVDWGAAGEAAATLMPLLTEAVNAAHGREKARAELWGEIMTALGPIYTTAITVEQGGVPWAHPSVMANLVYATLREAGQPLSDAQEDALDRLGMRFLEEDTRRREGYGEATPKLRRMLEQSILQDRFYADVRGILNDAQEAVLYPPGVRGVVGLDVFSGAGTWDEHLERLPHEDRADLRQRVHGLVMKELKLRPELGDAVKALVAEWETSLPDAFVLAEPDRARLADVDMEPSARVRFAAGRQLALFEAMLARLALDEEERARLIGADDVLVPILRR